MTKYISIAQLKGGSGKTTLASIVISYLISKKKKVLAIDSDLPQATLSAWGSLLEDPNVTFAECTNTDELAELLKSADGEYDYVITDTPPRIESTMRMVLLASDLVLVPMAATAPDIWAFSDMVNAIHALYDEENPDLSHIRIVWNEYKPTKKAELVRADTVQEYGFKDFEQYISNYVAYSDVIGAGKHIMIHNHPKSKIQVENLGKQIVKALK